MIDEIKDLTLKDKTKLINRRKITLAFFQTLPLSMVAISGMCLYALFINGEFLDAFTNAKAFETTGRFLTMALLMVALFFACYSYTDKGKFAARNFTLSTIVIVITFVCSLTAITYLNEYALPILFASLIMHVLTDRRTAIATTCVIAVMLLSAYVFSSPDIKSALPFTSVTTAVLANTISTLAVVFLLDRHLTRLKFLLSSLVLALLCIPLTVTSTIAAGDLSINILRNIVWSYVSDVAAIFVFMPMCAIFEGIFNIADDFKLNELTNLNNPLLKRLQSEAPGTFNHSLVVGTLAEACASAIGENPHLAKCAAYYHDIGKLKAPIYFAENQSSYNPHDELIPEVSVSMIIAHTMFGEILAKQYHLPPEIVAICREHHGTTPVTYFYNKALSMTEEGDLQSANYTYSGPKPQSKIAAIVMIADTIEAACRAYMPDTKEEFVAKIDKLVADKLNLGQFDECPITIDDIHNIKLTMIDVLPSIHHSRVSYDKRRK